MTLYSSRGVHVDSLMANDKHNRTQKAKQSVAFCGLYLCACCASFSLQLHLIALAIEEEICLGYRLMAAKDVGGGAIARRLGLSTQPTSYCPGYPIIRFMQPLAPLASSFLTDVFCNPPALCCASFREAYLLTTLLTEYMTRRTPRNTEFQPEGACLI